MAKRRLRFANDQERTAKECLRLLDDVADAAGELKQGVAYPHWNYAHMTEQVRRLIRSSTGALIRLKALSPVDWEDTP